MVGGACSSSERVQLWQLQNSHCKIVADRCVIVSDRKAHGLEIVTTGAIVDDSRVKSHEVSLQPVIADIERSSLSFLTLMFVAQYRGALGDLRPRKDPRKKPIDDFSRGRRGSGSEKVVDEPGPSTATIHTLHCLTDLRFRLARARITHAVMLPRALLLFSECKRVVVKKHSVKSLRFSGSNEQCNNKPCYTCDDTSWNL